MGRRSTAVAAQNVWTVDARDQLNGTWHRRDFTFTFFHTTPQSQHNLSWRRTTTPARARTRVLVHAESASHTAHVKSDFRCEWTGHLH
jgi:hypothetical protein